MEKHDYISHRELFAHELTRLRTQQGLSKGQFAMMVGVSRRYLIKLEAAKASPTLDMMERLAAGLDTAVINMVDFETIALRMSQDTGDSSSNTPIVSEFRG